MSDPHPGAAAAQEAVAGTESPSVTADAEQGNAQEVAGSAPQVTPADLAAQASATADGSSNETAETFDREYVEKLRRENASYRSRAKEIEEAKTAELETFKQEMAKALGLVEDTTDDPAKLLEAATRREQEIAAERDTMAQQLRVHRETAAVNAAAAKVAEATGGKIDTALLNAVLTSGNALGGLQIDADDFDAQVAAAVSTAVQNHPQLVAQAAPSSSGVDTSTTNSGVPGKLSPEDLSRLASEGKWDEINEAAASGRIA